MPDVFIWFEKYAEDRCKHFMNNSESKSIEDKQKLERLDFNDRTAKFFEDLKKDIADPEERERRYQQWKKENDH